MSVKLASMPKLEVADTKSIDWNPVCYITYNRDSWVKLYEPPNEYSDQDALLLCEKSAGVWVAWVAGYGEIELEKSEFYC